jgi:predicted dehydrogenase
MVERKIPVAVVGVGSLGQHHARIYSEMPDAELVAVVDRDPARAEEIASRCNCLALTDHQEIPDGVEAVSIAAPTIAHCDIGLELLEKGINVLVEKPIASAIGDAERLVHAAKTKNRIIHIGHTERFNPIMVSVRPYVNKPRFFETHRLGVFVGRSLDIDVVLDLMIHDIDLILSFVNEPVKEVRAVGIPILTPKVDIANVRLEFENGCVANLTASRVSRERTRKFRIFQSNDYISLDFQNQNVEMYSLEGKEGKKQIIVRDPVISEGEPLKMELEAFLSTIRGNSVPGVCTGGQGKKSLELALQIVDQIN